MEFLKQVIAENEDIFDEEYRFSNGDTRILTLKDKILPYSIQKLPGKDDFKFNTHSDKFFKLGEITKDELKMAYEVLEQVKQAEV